ncbi:MAG: Ig-like domain-containing protein [Bryobacteraceae bacterium]|jgi:uncharacterized protein (TIGR03437 family)
MLNRVFALCAFGVALSCVSLHAQDLFVLPGAAATNGEVQAFVTTPLTTFRTFDAGVGAFAVLPNLNASKYFIVGSSTTNSIIATDSTFIPATVVANLGTPASQALITPDGKLLAVVAGTVHLYNTASNNELVSGGVSQGSGITTVGIAASLDSSTIFAVGSNSTGAGQLAAINTTTYAVTATLALSQAPTGVSVGPNGLVYVTMPNQILEVDPLTLQATFNGAISVSGTPGPLVFTPDGQYALGANQSTFGNSLIVATLASHTATDPSLGLPQTTSLQIIGTDTVLAVTDQGVYQVTISTPISVNQVQVSTGGGGFAAITTTNDVPVGLETAVQAAYFISANTVYQYSPNSQAIIAQYPVASNVTPGSITYAVAAATTPTSVPTSLLSYGTNQTILPNGTSEPLVVQVLTANNVPLSGYDVQFQISGNGGTLYATSAITGSNGYAVTYLTASATPGAVTVTATAGSLSTSFTVNVSSTAQTGTGPTLSIVGGQGQLLFAQTNTESGSAYGSSLQVLATDANGNPITALPVTFSVPSSEGTLEASGVEGASTQVVNTNAAGVASVDFLTTTLPSNDTQGFLQTLVTASANGTSPVTFYITTVPSSPTPTINLLAPQIGTPITGSELTVLPGAVKVQVASVAGLGIPNVALSLNNGNVDPTLFPTASCNAPGGIVLTNSNGVASCDALFGPRVGSGTFTANIGDTHSSVPLAFTVTTGAPSTLQITQGNNQSGGPGQTLPLALVVNVTDSGGNIITGAAVNWQVVTAGTVTLKNIISVTDSNGNASALAVLGSIGGVAQVTATAGSASATFNLTVNIPSAGLQKVSGDQQSTVINTAFASPLTVKVVDSNGNGVTGAQVNFQVASGVATLGTSSAITDSTGQASTTVTAGGTAGAITVSATSSTFSVSFSLTARLPGPSNLTIVNGASFDPNTGISPGGIATIRGVGILPGVTGLLSAANSAGQLPTTFSGVTITFNGTAAPIYYVDDTNGADQVSVQVPFEVQPGSAVSVTVSVASEGSATITVPVKPLAPGVFTSSYGGKIYAVAVRPDGSQVSPTNPAQRGENIQLYVTGLGQATPLIATGAAGVADQGIVSTMIVGLNNGGVPLISAVYGPGLIGVYVVTLQVPADTQTGPYQPIGVVAYDSSNNVYFAQPTYIPIQ